MACKKHKTNDFRGILILVLTILPLVASTNINCNGKPFHCVNSTYFMICVDIGGGYSSTIDNLIIPCPPTTVCTQNNRFECEFPPTPPSTPILEILHLSTKSIGNESKATKQNVVTTDLFNQTTDAPIHNNINSVNPMTLNKETSTIVYEQQANVTPTSNIQAINNVPAKTNTTDRSIDTFTITSTANTTKYPNSDNIQVIKVNTIKENHTVADAVNKFTTLETYVSGSENITTNTKDIFTDRIKPEITTEPTAFVTNIQKTNTNGSDNIAISMSPTSAYSQNFSNTVQDPSYFSNPVKELHTTTMVTELPVISTSLLIATTEAAMKSAFTQTNKDGKEIIKKVQERSTVNNFSTGIPTSPVSESILITPQSSNLSIVEMGLVSTQSELTLSPVITESPMLSVSTVVEYYPTSVISENKVNSTDNTTTSTTLSIINSTAETLHNNVTSKTNESPAKQPKFNAGTEGSLYSHHITDTVGGDLIDAPAKYISSMSASGQNVPNTLHKTATTISNTNTFNAQHTNAMMTEANTKILNGSMVTAGSHIIKDWQGVGTTSLVSPISNISNTVKPTSLVTEPILTAQQSSTSSVVNIELVSTPNKPTTSSVSTDILKLSVSTMAENISVSVNPIADASSTNNEITSKISSTTINSIAETLHNNDSLKTNQASTEQPKLNYGTEGRLPSHHLNVTIGTIGGNLIKNETISSVPMDSQNNSYILQETSTTGSNTNTFSGPLTTNIVTVTITDKTNRSSDSHIKAIESTIQGSSTLNLTNTVKPTSLVTEPSLTVLKSSASSIADIGSVYTENVPTFPVSTDPTMISVNTAAENNPSVNFEIFKRSTNNIFGSKTPTSTTDSTTKKIHNNVIPKRTDASTKQPVLNVGTEGSLFSHHLTHNTIGGNTIEITTEYLSSTPVNAHNISNMLEITPTITLNINTSHGPITTDNVTEAIIDIANRSTDSHLNNDWKGLRTTIQERPTLNMSNTVESSSPATKTILTGNTRFSTSSAIDTGFVSEQSKLVTSSVSTDSPTLSMSIVSEMYPTSTNSDISRNGNMNTVTKQTSLATTDVSAITLTNHNISKITQTGDITIKAKQTNIGTERGWISYTTDTVGSHTVNPTTENIPTIPINGLIVSSTLQNMASTSPYSNASNEMNKKELVAVPNPDKAYRSSDTLGSQGWDGTVPTIQEISTLNITDTVRPTSSVTQLKITGYTQSSTPTVSGIGLIPEQSEPTISPVTTDSSILSVNTISEKYSNSKSFDRGTNVTENTNISEPSIVSNLIVNQLNNNTNANATQAYTILPDIGTEINLSSYNTSNNIIGNSTNNIDTKNITTIPVDGQDISNVVQDTVTTRLYANNFDATLSTNMATEVYNNTISKSTDILIKQNGKSLLQDNSTFNISENIKTSSPIIGLILSDSSVSSTLSVKGMDQSQATTSPTSTGTIILSVSTITEYPTSLHFDNTANTTKNTNTNNITLATLDVNYVKLNNENIFTTTESTTQKSEPNGRTANGLPTNNTTDTSMRGNTTPGQNYSDKQSDTTIPSSYSNTFIEPNTTKMTPVAIVDIANRSIDSQITQNWDIVITTIYDNSTFNSSNTVNTTSPVMVVASVGNPESSTSNIPIDTPVNTDTILSMTTVSENYSPSAHFNMSANITNNTQISETSSTVSGVNNNVFKTTQTHRINPEINTEISLSPFNTTSADTISIIFGNILKGHTSGQNGSINILPDIKTTSLYSNNFNGLHTTRTVAKEVTNTENRSTHTIADQNLDTVLTTIPDSSTVNSSDIIQMASSTTVVIITGDRLSSTPAVVRNNLNSASPLTLPMSTITEKYSSSININMINNTVKENSTSYSIVEKSNTTSTPYEEVLNAGTESGLTSYTSRNTDDIIWLLKNSTTQGIKHVTNSLINYESIGMGSETSITTPTTFIDGSLTMQSISSSTPKHTENMMTNTGSNKINEQTTPVISRKQDFSAGTVNPTESNSSLYVLDKDTIKTKQTNNNRTTELNDKNNATISNNNNVNTFNTGSTSRKIDIITTTLSITNPLENLLFNKMSKNQEYSSSTLETGSSLTTQESNNNNGLTMPPTLSTNFISAKTELYLPVTSTPQKHIMDFETNKTIAMSDLQYKITQNNETTTLSSTDQTSRTETFITKNRNIVATTQAINITSNKGNSVSDYLASINHSNLNNTEIIRTKQTIIGNNTKSFPGINYSNKSNGILEQPDIAVNILPTTKYVSDNELPILTTISSGQTTELHSSVGNVANITASIDTTHGLSDQNRNKAHNNSKDTLNGNNLMKSVHDISNQDKNIMETKSNRTEEINRIRIDNQAVNHERTSKQLPNSVPKVNALALINPQYMNVDGGSTNIAGSFNCRHHRRGRYADNDDCRKFYICIGNHQLILGTCPVNTVFSEINKQCTKNLSHCIRNNQFQCTTEGRFSDYLNDSIYYICLRNGAHGFVRFQLQCQSGYYLNKTAVRCTRNSDETSESKSVDSDSSKRNNDPNITDPKSQESEESVRNYRSFTCEKEGKFADSNDCRRYYVCSKRNQSGFRRKMKMCDSDEVFHKDKKKCVAAESNEC